MRFQYMSLIIFIRFFCCCKTKNRFYTSSSYLTYFLNILYVLIDKLFHYRRRLLYYQKFDYYFSFVSKEERKILKYPIFLRSEFFQNDYYELLRGQECRIDGLSINYLNNFFRVLKTFNIDDPNLNFYLETILDSFSSEEEIENFHKERIKNKDAGIEVVGNSLYDILATSNEEAVEKYITMLEQAPSDLDLKSDTKTVYQKK